MLHTLRDNTNMPMGHATGRRIGYYTIFGVRQKGHEYNVKSCF